MEEEPIQCIFDFESGNQDGYENFRKEQEAKNQRFRDVWKVPVGRKVRITLVGVPGSFEGKLTVAEQPEEFNRKVRLHLKVGKTGFYHNEIESCSVSPVAMRWTEITNRRLFLAE